jgi:hypothetical protein
MKFDPKIHHRHSIRLKGYDYSQAGAYFVTIVAWQRETLFGEIVDGEMALNDFGKIVAEEWQWLETQYEYVELGAWIIMPNHLHGILVIHDDGRGGSRSAPTPIKRKPLGGLIGAFKTVSTKQINLLREPKVRLSGSGIITSGSSATNPKWTGFPVTLNPTQHNGRMMMKTQIVFIRRGRLRTTPM